MKIAMVHDYFTQMGGAEKVAEELYNMLPGADLFATVALKDKMPESIRDVPVTTSWMQNLPRMRDLYRLYFPLYPFAVSSLDLSQYDLVVSSSSGYVKGVQVAPDAIHVCYCHTPMRWVWNFDNYSSRESFAGGVKAVLPTLIRGLRIWDEAAARQPDHFVANSQTVAARIKRAYGRSAEVIVPPIDIHRFKVSLEQDDYYVVLARLVPYKRIDLAVSACTALGRKLVVIGSGPALEGLKKDAGPTIHFAGRASDAQVEEYVSRCRALIFPGEEDFGMAPLEVAAAGRPTIAYRAGGAMETVVEGVTGVFFNEQTTEEVVDAIERFERQEWAPLAIRLHAEGFSTEVFREKFAAFLRRVGAPID
ncbi:glycosyltransferase [Granulicella tundricola]|uniref:Glycosyl transferase group 1 n=1 Tax=Granulicella tundricola (strain ATCC BAA-1859 / DSM 23138 / MP5ACTX9) TaxID=1198114 RepID=E8X7T5_GRATM|nr:glycosyltransferase [Granulicella tundricola]ADW71519.1 glycosyl transferase group 1 [Granulicella tundricola MP5ACTX9]